MQSTQAPSDIREGDQATSLPAHVRVLSNGTLLDTQTHRFLPGSKPTSAIASSEQARGMANRRHELAAKAARTALAQRAEADGLQRSPIAAYAVLAGAAYDSALANMLDKPREAVEAGKFTLRLAGMLPQDDRQAQAVAAVQIVLAPEAASFVEGVWRAAGGQDEDL